MLELVIEVCQWCRGNGHDRLSVKPCPSCNSSGYPVGYTPPTTEECLEYSGLRNWSIINNYKRITEERITPCQQDGARFPKPG